MPIIKKRLEEIKAFKNTDFPEPATRLPGSEGSTLGSPELPDKQQAHLRLSHYRNMANYKPIKKSVNVRLDADVIEWLRSAGRGYQTRMNAILREAMLHSGS